MDISEKIESYVGRKVDFIGEFDNISNEWLKQPEVIIRADDTSDYNLYIDVWNIPDIQKPTLDELGLITEPLLPSKDELGKFVVAKKQSVAYSGYHFVKNGVEYITSTAEKDIGKITLTLMTATTNINWQVYTSKGERAYLTLTKEEFQQLIAAGSNFVNQQFVKEAQFLAELSLAEITKEFVADFKNRVEEWV